MGERQSDFCHLEILNPPLLSCFPSQDWYLWGLTKGPPPSSPKVSFFPTPGASSAFFVHCAWVDSFFFFFQNNVLFGDANQSYARSLQSAFLCLHFLPLTLAFRLIKSFPAPFPHGSFSNKAVWSFPSWGGNHLLAQVAAESRCLKQWVEDTTFHGHECLSFSKELGLLPEDLFEWTYVCERTKSSLPFIYSFSHHVLLTSPPRQCAGF